MVRRINNLAALDLLCCVLRGSLATELTNRHTRAAMLSINERFQDLPFDLADASAAEVAPSLKVRQVLTIDFNFDVYRDKVGKVSANVLR